MKYRKHIIVVFLTVGFILSGCSGSNRSDKQEMSAESRHAETQSIISITAKGSSASSISTKKEESKPSQSRESVSASSTTPSKESESVEVDFKHATVGSVIKFGKYEQDNDLSNGKEKIEWRVLTKEGNRILVISKYGLNSGVFSDTGATTPTTWETCVCRKWLNEEFFKDAFDESEQSVIPTSTVPADRNPNFKSISAGNNTSDRVFLLSVVEAEKYFSSNQDRLCEPTEYAKATWKTGNYNGHIKGDNFEAWWLRSPGYASYSVSRVTQGGGIGYARNDYRATMIRPAIWISII